MQAGAWPALMCRPLSSRTTHLYTTRHWTLGRRRDAVDDDGAWAEVAEAAAVSARDLVRVRQVHGTDVHMGPLTGERPQADIVLAGSPPLAAAIQVADCVPLLLVDGRQGAVAAVHAGWRGLAARVPARAVAALMREFGTSPADLHAAIGPAIGACCYEVGPDVAQAFAAAGFDAERLARCFLATPAGSERNPSLPGLSSAPRMDRWFLDTWQLTRDLLEEAGVPAGQIYGAELCTASHAGVFCSYRRDGSPAGRQAGVILAGRRDP